MFRVKVETADGAVQVFDLKDGDNVIGRSRSCDIAIGAPDISRAHCKIVVSADGAVAENLSQYGSLLDDAPIEAPARLSAGRKIRIGRGTTITFEEVREEESPPSAEEISGEPVSMPTGAPAGTSAPESVRTPEPVKPPAAEENLAELEEEPEAGPATGAEVTGAEVTGAAPAPAEMTGAGVPPTGAGPSQRTSREVPAAAAFDDGTGFGTAVDMTSEGASLAGGETGLSAAEEEGATRAMRTRVASPEEIDFLRVAEQKRIRQRMMMIVGGAIAIVALAVIFRPKPLPPETVIKWPTDADDKALEALVPSPGGGRKEGGFDLVVPATRGWSKNATPGGFVIETHIGRKRDVPMYIILEEERDKRFLDMDLEQAAQDAVKRLSESEGRWNFEKLSPATYFYGRDNGIPFRYASYEREKEGSWFGVVSVFMHGPRRIGVRTEVPSSERLRAENMVYSFLVEPSPELVSSHWQGSAQTPAGTTQEMLQRVRQEMRRMAPATWAELQDLLMALLTHAEKNDDEAAKEEALALLVKLRERQSLWFNSQQLAMKAANAQGDERRARQITDLTKAVFSNMNDQRYYEVRKW